MSRQARHGLGAVKNSMESSSSGDFVSIPYIGWETGEEKIIRFLTEDDDVLVLATHNWLTRTDGKGKWGSAICRMDSFIGGDSCPLCDANFRPSDRVFTLAVEREGVFEEEEFTKPGGSKGHRRRLVGLKTKTRTEKIKNDKDEEEEVVVPDYGIIQAGMKNFFSTLVGYCEDYGTLVDRDYKIKRIGSGIDTIYQIQPLEPVEVDLEKIRSFVPSTLEDYLVGLGDEKRMHDMFLTGEPVEEYDDSDEGEDEGVETSGSGFDEARERLRGSKSY